jgi:hypothetical protein
VGKVAVGSLRKPSRWCMAAERRSGRCIRIGRGSGSRAVELQVDVGIKKIVERGQLDRVSARDRSRVASRKSIKCEAQREDNRQQ